MLLRHGRLKNVQKKEKFSEKGRKGTWEKGRKGEAEKGNMGTWEKVVLNLFLHFSIVPFLLPKKEKQCQSKGVGQCFV